MPEPRTPQSARAARRVLLEVFDLLRPHPDAAILVGGMVPFLRFEGDSEPHQGTLDVDLVLSGRPAGLNLGDMLKKRGYFQRGDFDAFQYFRSFDLEGRKVTVRLDLLVPEAVPDSTRLVPTQGVAAFPVHGGELARDGIERLPLSGPLPEGDEERVEVAVAGVVPFLALKAFALRDRRPPEPKDAYDLYYCLRHHRGGMAALALAFGPFRGEPLLVEAAGILRQAFSDPDAWASRAVADASSLFASGEPDALALDASERALALADLMQKTAEA